MWTLLNTKLILTYLSLGVQDEVLKNEIHIFNQQSSNYLPKTYLFER